MKRDMDLIRLLLLEQEQGEPPAGLSEYPQDVQAYHAALLVEAGLVVGIVDEGPSGEVAATIVNRLTWAGHDFLDAARSDTTWNKVKGKVVKSGLSLTFSTLLEVLKFEAHAQLAKQGLLPPE